MTQKTRYAARAAFWSTVLCVKGLFQRVEGWWEGKNSREKNIRVCGKRKGRTRVRPGSTNVPLDVNVFYGMDSRENL